jgi:hypothetical protein
MEWPKTQNWVLKISLVELERTLDLNPTIYNTKTVYIILVSKDIPTKYKALEWS